ncbi:tRNA pseudouridine(38-40) synthase TruA [Chitinasiproducens palmae]|uniref:tRNA pseudouridine synthase A n=1 Tax=Chitinasiproducens palmae TaxID=1770053 RepID=A0A1H2PNC6_9BURK|nr:tRNA pseudouridine(38-40) synthase TruA [Chitinasiproducens palmae]SDV47672.1 tRNA pseudouridine38-40 synthase [Chitinasiproducens palmae]
MSDADRDAAPTGLRRIALGVQYDGAAFRGWQAQPGGGTVQDALEAALARFAAMPIRTVVAGRTDTGVHALGQVVHFETPLSRADFSWVRGLNTYLPRAIAVQWAAEVPADFHARFSACARTYDYVLQVSPVRPALLAGRVGWVHTPLSVAAMREAAVHLLGTQDFSSFRSSECQAKSPVKTMYRIDIVAHGEFVRFRFCASAFLHHMVRNLVGCLVAVGRGRAEPAWLAQVVAARDRGVAAPTFMPDGLYLSEVGYPSRFTLPRPTLAALPGQAAPGASEALDRCDRSDEGGAATAEYPEAAR